MSEDRLMLELIEYARTTNPIWPFAALLIDQWH